MLETVRGAVRRLSKISNCAFQFDYHSCFKFFTKTFQKREKIVCIVLYPIVKTMAAGLGWGGVERGGWGDGGRGVIVVAAAGAEEAALEGVL